MRHPTTCSDSRRSFLRGCGLTLTGFGIASLFPTPLIRHALAGSTAPGKRLIFIFLRGGNDGINAVIPHGDPAYSPAIRPTRQRWRHRTATNVSRCSDRSSNPGS